MKYLVTIYLNNLDFETFTSVFVNKVSDLMEEKEKMIKSSMDWNKNNPGNFYCPMKLPIKEFNDVYLIEDFGWNIEIFDTLEINSKFKVSAYNKRLAKIRKRIVERIARIAENLETKNKLSDIEISDLKKIKENLMKPIDIIQYNYYDDKSVYPDWYVYKEKERTLTCEEKFPAKKRDKIVF